MNTACDRAPARCPECGDPMWHDSRRCRACWAKTLPPPHTRTNWRPKPRKDADLELLREWSEAHGGRSPSVSEWQVSRPAGAPSCSVYVRVFGSWVAAIDAAGLPPRLRDGAGRWEKEAIASAREPYDKKSRRMVTAGVHTAHVVRPGRLVPRHPRRRRDP